MELPVERKVVGHLATARVDPRSKHGIEPGVVLENRLELSEEAPSEHYLPHGPHARHEPEDCFSIQAAELGRTRGECELYIRNAFFWSAKRGCSPDEVRNRRPPEQTARRQELESFLQLIGPTVVGAGPGLRVRQDDEQHAAFLAGRPELDAPASQRDRGIEPSGLERRARGDRQPADGAIMNLPA